MSDDRQSIATPVVAVLLLVAIVAFNVIGDRDDKAWTFMIEQLEGFTGMDLDGKEPKKK